MLIGSSPLPGFLLRGLYELGWNCQEVDGYDTRCTRGPEDRTLAFYTLDGTDELPCQISFRRE